MAWCSTSTSRAGPLLPCLDLSTSASPGSAPRRARPPESDLCHGEREGVFYGGEEGGRAAPGGRRGGVAPGVPATVRERHRPPGAPRLRPVPVRPRPPGPGRRRYRKIDKKGFGSGDSFRVLLVDDARHTETLAEKALPQVVPSITASDARNLFHESRQNGLAVVIVTVKEHAEFYAQMIVAKWASVSH